MAALFNRIADRCGISERTSNYISEARQKNVEEATEEHETPSLEEMADAMKKFPAIPERRRNHIVSSYELALKARISSGVEVKDLVERARTETRRLG